jgi:hypothetical protein
LFSLELANGQFLTDIDFEQKSKACVLAFGVGQELFSIEDPVAKSVRTIIRLLVLSLGETKLNVSRALSAGKTLQTTFTFRSRRSGCDSEMPTHSETM